METASPAPVASTPHLHRLILDAARALLLAQGVDGLSMRKIARKIGYSPTALYLHFPHKDAILHALLDEGVAFLDEALVAALDATDGQPLEARMRALADAYVRWGDENPARYEVIFLLHPRHMERYPPEKFRAARNTLLRFADVLEEAGLPADRARVVGSGIWAQLHGLVSLRLAHRFDIRIPAVEVRAAVLDAVVAAARDAS